MEAPRAERYKPSLARRAPSLSLFVFPPQVDHFRILRPMSIHPILFRLCLRGDPDSWTL